MKNLESLYKEIEGRVLGQQEYLEKLGNVLQSQKLFTLTSCESDSGFLLRSDDGSYHIWFMQLVMSPVAGIQVTETGTWYSNQLSEAMSDLMNQMKLDCEGLISRDGAPV